MKRALLINGLDPSPNTGIVLVAFVAARAGLAPVTVATVVTAQNSSAFVDSMAVDTTLLRRQLESAAADGGFACAKVGAVGPADNAELIARFLTEARVPWVVVDPVLRSSSGGSLLDGPVSGIESLLRCAHLITPNAEEAALLLDCGVHNDAAAAVGERPVAAHGDVSAAVSDVAVALTSWLGTAVLVTGARHGDGAEDVLAVGASVLSLSHALVEAAGDPRGTGCAFATSIAVRLSDGLALPEAVRSAQTDLLGMLEGTVAVGGGRRQFDLARMTRPE
ncbi:MAG: bifunctional hydroxymethylpyrimidine kinase/phosphomethylpyrimidine kinase [Coriobacteriia bacterium]|nr:bifunctional hydroxymethylpyrimidine kinase/phosphomethylpyrimidine kinase [Coriobacteriia bacterium]